MSAPKAARFTPCSLSLLYLVETGVGCADGCAATGSGEGALGAAAGAFATAIPK